MDQVAISFFDRICYTAFISFQGYTVADRHTEEFPQGLTKQNYFSNIGAKSGEQIAHVLA